MPETPPTSERIYQVVKQQVLGGAFRPGERIDAAQLAEHHAASITPVRAALHRLVGEQLVDAQPSEGFHAPRVTEPSLRDLYAWNELILQLALRLSIQRAAPSLAAPMTSPGADGVDVANIAERLFASLGERSGNEQCLGAVRRLNDHLRLARLMEGHLFTDAPEEVRDLEAVLGGGLAADMKRSIARYHRRRLRSAADLVRLIYRPFDVRS